MRAGIYARISLDRDGDELGVTRQEKDCRRLATDRGWRVVDVYVDNDLSASKRDIARPAYERMLTDIAGGRIDAVIVWDLDRLTRQPRQLEEFVDLCDEHGITTLATVSGDVDLGSGDGLLVARIKGAVAAEEVRKMSKRIARKHAELAERGLPAGGGRRPYGYMADRMTINDVEAEHLRRAARMILDGATLTAACGTIPDITDITVLRRALTSPRTSGLRTYKGEIVGDAAWPPILDRDTWTEVRSTLSGRSRFVRPFRKHLLGGIARCGRCGAKLHAQVSSRRGQPGPAVYACRTTKGGCNSLSIVADRLERIVVAEVGGWLRDPRLAKAVTAALHGGQDADDTDALMAAIKADEARLAELAVEREEHGLELVEWKAMREPVLIRLENNRATLADARQRAATTSPVAEASPAELAAMWTDVDHPMEPAVRRALIAMFAAEIIVLPAGKGWRAGAVDRVRVRPVWA
jgi:DNA invertase Pin-like site-specific DNA recombinase